VLRVWRVLLYAACATLAGALGLQAVGRGVAIGVDSYGTEAFTALHVCFMLQLVALVGLLITASVRPTSVGRSALFWCGLLPFGEGAVIALVQGFSLLALFLATAGFSVFLAIATRPTRRAAGAALG
jgi:hypothetical protein